MKVCAIVLDYRRADLAAACVASLAGQVARVVVVDNSGDAAHSDRLAARLVSVRDPPLTLCRPGRNLGFAAGVNLALRTLADFESYGAFLLLNNDAQVGAGAVARLAEALRDSGGDALVAPECTESGMPLRLWYQPALGLVTHRPLWGAFDYLSGACLLVPRALATGGLFDEAFFMYGEDAELGARMHRRGVRLLTVPAALVSHIGNASEPAGGAFYEYHTARSHLLLAGKLAPTRALRLLYLAGRAGTLPLRAALRGLRRGSLVPLAALVRAWRGMQPQPSAPP